MIKLSLNNFRFHKSLVIQFPPTGFVNLAGKFGSGKSTVIKGIVYTLYGNVKKPVTHGEKTCTVSLEIKNLVITRSTSPNKLTVEIISTENVLLEDEVAQNHINNTIMTYDEFMASSYVVQRSFNSVITKTPAEQLAFIEKLSFTDDAHNLQKKIFKTISLESKKNISNIEANVSLLISNISTLQKKTKKSFDKSLIESSEKLKIKFEKIKSQQSSINSTISKLQKELDGVKTLEASQSKLVEKRKVAEIELVNLRERVHTITTDELWDVEIESLEKDQDKLRRIISTIEKFISSKEIEKEIEDITSNLNKTRRNEIKTLSKQIPKDFDEEFANEYISRHEEYISQNTIRDNIISQKTKAKKDLINLAKHIKQTHTDIFPAKVTNVKELRKILKDKIIENESVLTKILSVNVKCPCCDKKVTFNTQTQTLEKIRGKSVSSNADPEELRELTDVLKDYRSKFDKITEESSVVLPEITVDFDEEQSNEYASILRIVEKLSDLQSSTPEEPLYLLNLREKYSQIQSSISKNFSEKYVCKLEEYQTRYKSITSDIQTINRLNADQATLSREIRTREKLLKEIDENLRKSTGNKRSSDTINEEMSLSQKEFGKVSREFENISESMSLINEYDKYTTNIEYISSLKKQLDELYLSLGSEKSKLNSSLVICECIKQAENTSILSALNLLNIRVKKYLRLLFDIPISVRLEWALATGKIRTIIECRGDVFSGISELSGGEQQLCELAFLLASNDILNSNIIILDESINNLDPEYNFEILQKLSEIAKEKLIILVSHEASTGPFDKILRISQNLVEVE